MNESAPLAYEETKELIRLAQQGDEAAQERLTVCNTALVKSIVKRYMNRHVEYDDLFQIGCMGLVKAIQKFDLSYDVRFSTYAVPMIAGEIKRFLRDDGMIKVSRTLKELAAQAAAARERLSAEQGRDVGISEIAAALDVDAEDIAAALEASRPHMSIYEPAYGDDSDALMLDRVQDGADEMGDTLNRVLLKELLGTLEPRERTIILLRYFSDKTQNEIAAEMGISQVQVSRLETKILQKLRERAAN
ncbi:MAG: SigB/SigF/SigG family RNA polymerase sigma factor [Clostridium sp.]|jgi:RNA polymerase sporulation-specific sigma factor|nr:SigB/SigF/SigG family RNA polymerase sigma factor [Clostridium sp.]MCI5913610.1 SigB/SigF/SigG family RNA polymerase sigma factor [Christensenella sp.]